MLLVLSATLLCAATVYILRDGLLVGGPVVVSGFDGVGVVIGFMVFVVCAVIFGPIFGTSIIISLLLHELGHFIAYRCIGHKNVRFRLVPILNGVRSSDTPLISEAESFFVSIMGPGISIAPMVLAYVMSIILAPTDIESAGMLRIFAVTCGALNFLNLLPFWPLDGGKCTQLFARNFWPALAPAFTIFMAAMFFTAGLRTGSVSLFILAGIGVQSLLRKDEPRKIALGPDRALTAMATYAFVLAAHFSAGWWLLSQYF